MKIHLEELSLALVPLLLAAQSSVYLALAQFSQAPLVSVVPVDLATQAGWASLAVPVV